jgi:hypothetical protein
VEREGRESGEGGEREGGGLRDRETKRVERGGERGEREGESRVG